MAASIEIALHIRGDDPLDQALRQQCEWLESIGPHTSAYQEVVAHLCLIRARMAWRDADRYRAYENRAAERQRRRDMRNTGGVGSGGA